MNGLASAAAAYVAEGLSIIPLRPHSKRPATLHGKNDATADPGITALRFPQDTDRNIGILTGAEAGLLVVDIDPRNGGDEAFKRLERAFGALPETRRVVTGGDGVHLYFRLPPETIGLSDRPNVAGFRGVDLKAGGYVVAPPSIHESGKAYEVANDLPVADAPDWLIKLGQGGKRIEPAAPRGKSLIEEGGRNDTLFRLACGLPYWSRLAVLEWCKRGLSRKLIATSFDCSLSTVGNVLTRNGGGYDALSGMRRLTESQRHPVGSYHRRV